MTTTAPVVTATQVYRVYIKATADAIWTAITDPEWTNRYGYTGYTHYEPLEKGGALTVDREDWSVRLKRLREHGMNVSAADRHKSAQPVLEPDVAAATPR